MKQFLSLAAAACILAASSMTASADPQDGARRTHSAPGMAAGQGLTTGTNTNRPSSPSGGNAALQGNNGNSGQGSNSVGNVQGGNIGAGK